MKAEWIMEYDWRNDKCYDCPGCKKCQAPIFQYEDGKYYCVSCQEEAEIDDKMKKWFEDRQGEKEETTKCMGCGNNTMKIHYHKNQNTCEWQVGYGECECGCRFIV